MFEFSNFEEYMKVRLDIFQLLKIKNNKNLLTKKPKRFFIYCIYLHIKGIDISSIDAAEQLRDYMGWNTSDDVYTCRTKLKRQGWLVPDSNSMGGYSILPSFKFTDETLSKNYNFTVICQKENIKINLNES